MVILMELGYYSNRIGELEKREAELKGTIVTAKLSLRAVNNEIEACKEAMNNQTWTVRTDADRKDEIIADLKKKVSKDENEISKLKLENTQLKHDLQNSRQETDALKRKNDDLKLEMQKLKIDIENLKSGTKSDFSEDWGDENIFDQITRGLCEK